MLTYENDPLLLEKETANDLIKQNREELLFLDKEKKILNLFSAFVSKKDFVSKHKRVQPLQRTVYVKVNSNLAKILDEKCSNAKRVRDLIKEYTRLRTNCQVDKWIKNNIFPLIFLRILSKDLEELAEWITNVEYITDYLGKSKFIPPKTLKQLLNHKISYFVGCSMGDGHIEKNGRRWKLVDGSSDASRLEISHEFVSRLSFLLSQYINNLRISQTGNKYELVVNNKPFCRFLNFFFALPRGKKKNVILQVPSIFTFSSEDLQKYFWRGLFDTDGHAGKAVSFCSSDGNLLEQLVEYLQMLDINPKISTKNVSIPISDNKKFCSIGFAHPRKQIEFMERLKCGPSLKCVKIKANMGVDPRLLQIYDVLRIDEGGFRVRIHSITLNKKKIKLEQVEKIVSDLFGYKFRRAANGMYYFKSKKVYEYLRSIFIYKNFWHPIDEEEETQLFHIWNDVWKQ